MRGDKPKASANVHRLASAARLNVPDPPGHMSDAAKEKWRQLAPELTRKSRLNPEYQDFFEIYCEAYADYRRNQKLLQIEGFLYLTTGRNGALEKKKQALVQRDEAWSAMIRVGGFFGMSPRDDAALGESKQGDFLAVLEDRLNGRGA